MSKLTGNVDPAKIIEFAPGELKNLPGFEGQGDGSASTLGGFDAWQVGGSYVKNGTKRMIAQKTVVIPARTVCTCCSSTPTASRTKWGR